MTILKQTIHRLLLIVQKQIDKAYEEDGLTDEILELQLKVNEIRANSNIPLEDNWLQ